MRAPHKAYAVRFILAMTGYVLVTISMPVGLQLLGEQNPLRYVVVLTPVIPLIFAFIAYLRYLRDVDELERKIQLEGVSISLATTMFITLALGFLEMVDVPKLPMIWVPIMMIATWGAGVTIAKQKYAWKTD